MIKDNVKEETQNNKDVENFTTMLDECTDFLKINKEGNMDKKTEEEIEKSYHATLQSEYDKSYNKMIVYLDNLDYDTIWKFSETMRKKIQNCPNSNTQKSLYEQMDLLDEFIDNGIRKLIGSEHEFCVNSLSLEGQKTLAEQATRKLMRKIKTGG